MTRINWLQWEGSTWPSQDRVKLMVFKAGGLFRFALTIKTHDYMGPLEEVTVDTPTKHILLDVLRYLLEHQSPYAKEDYETLLKFIHQNPTLCEVVLKES